MLKNLTKDKHDSLFVQSVNEWRKKFHKFATFQELHSKVKYFVIFEKIRLGYIHSKGKRSSLFVQGVFDGIKKSLTRMTPFRWIIS